MGTSLPLHWQLRVLYVEVHRNGTNDQCTRRSSLTRFTFTIVFFCWSLVSTIYINSFWAAISLVGTIRLNETCILIYLIYCLVFPRFRCCVKIGVVLPSLFTLFLFHLSLIRIEYFSINQLASHLFRLFHSCCCCFFWNWRLVWPTVTLCNWCHTHTHTHTHWFVIPP